MTKTDIADHLLALLQDERKALLSGELETLPKFIPVKEKLLGALDPTKVDQNVIENMRQAAIANQALLEAALKGVNAARERIEIVKNGGPSLNTYDASGKASSTGTARSNVVRRA